MPCDTIIRKLRKNGSLLSDGGVTCRSPREFESADLADRILLICTPLLMAE